MLLTWDYISNYLTYNENKEVLCMEDLNEVSEANYHKSYELFYEGLAEENPINRIRLLKEAVKLNSLNFEAKIELAMNEDNDFIRLAAIKNVLNEVEEVLIKIHRINPYTHAVDLDKVVEAKPFFMAKSAHMSALMAVGYYYEALIEAKEILNLLHEDVIGVRFIVQQILIITKDYKQLDEMHAQYNESTFQWNFPMAIAYFNEDKQQKAEEIICTLNNQYHFMQDLFFSTEIDYDDLVKEPHFEKVYFTLVLYFDIIEEPFFNFLVKTLKNC